MTELEPKFQALIGMVPVRFGTLPRIVPERGYVGRTNGIRKRLQNHCRLSGTHFTATFAFRIAREETGRKATYKPEGSRAALINDPVFGPAFERAKTRVNDMDIRYVEERDAVRQALLEIYAATVLNARYNDFDNH